MTRLPAATSSAREVRGFCTATTFRPLAWRIGMTLSQLEPSANAPWISTTVFCSVACAIAIQGSINEMSNNLNMLLLLKGPPLPDTGKCTASVHSKSCGCFRHHGGLLTERTVCCASPIQSDGIRKTQTRSQQTRRGEATVRWYRSIHWYQSARRAVFTLLFPSTSRAARESLDQHVTNRGAPRLLEYLSKSQIPLAVATSERMTSAKYNLELLGSDAKRTVVITRDGVCRVKTRSRPVRCRGGSARRVHRICHYCRRQHLGHARRSTCSG